MVPETVGELEAIDDTTCRLQVATHSLDWLAMRLALLHVDFTVESPDALCSIVGRLGYRLTRSAAQV